MNQTVTLAIIEPAAVTLSAAARLNLGKLADRINTLRPDLDTAERMVWAVFGTQPLPWFIYRGGNHVALHRKSGSERVLIVEARPALAVEWPEALDYDSIQHFGTEAEKAALAASQAPQATNAVQAYVDSLPRQERLYAAAYAHWLDEVGADGAVERLQQEGRTLGLDARTRQFIRVAVNTAKGGR